MLRHLDLFSGIKKDPIMQGHIPCGQSEHDRLDRESILCQDAYCVSTSKTRSAHAQVYGLCPELDLPHKPDKLSGHQETEHRTFLNCRQYRVFSGFYHNIPSSSRVSCRQVSPRICFLIPSLISWHIQKSNAAYFALLPLGEKREFHIDDSSGLLLVCVLYLCGTSRFRTCGYSICAMPFALQTLIHTLHKILLAYPHLYLFRDNITQNASNIKKGGDALCREN